MDKSALIPWREVCTWSCTACGKCCVGYHVPLKMDEYVRVAKIYGYNAFDFGLGRVYLKQTFNGQCIFQHPSQGRWVCELQSIKPLACKLFPFRIHSKPIYSRGDRSEYVSNGQTFYIYLDPDCEGIVFGKPSERFLKQILPEVVQIGLGQRWKQKFTTSKYLSWTAP